LGSYTIQVKLKEGQGPSDKATTTAEVEERGPFRIYHLPL